MRIAVFGATGRTGAQVVDQALAAGHEVSAFVRNPDRTAAGRPGLTILPGDLADGDAVARVVAGSGAVISALGVRRPEDVQPLVNGTANVIAAMRHYGVRRLVAQSGAGVAVRADRRPPLDVLIALFLRVTGLPVVEEKRREYLLIRDSGLDWTVVRPTRIVDGPLTQSYSSDASHLRSRGKVSRADVAHFMLAQLESDEYLHRAPFLFS